MTATSMSASSAPSSSASASQPLAGRSALVTGASRGFGRAAVAAYAARQGVGEAAFLAARGPVLAADQVGAAFAGLAADPALDAAAYALTAAGLEALA